MCTLARLQSRFFAYTYAWRCAGIRGLRDSWHDRRTDRGAQQVNVRRIHDRFFLPAPGFLHDLQLPAPLRLAQKSHFFAYVYVPGDARGCQARASPRSRFGGAPIAAKASLAGAGVDALFYVISHKVKRSCHIKCSFWFWPAVSIREGVRACGDMATAVRFGIAKCVDRGATYTYGYSRP